MVPIFGTAQPFMPINPFYRQPNNNLLDFLYQGACCAINFLQCKYVLVSIENIGAKKIRALST